MLKTLELLKRSPIVKSYDILDFKQGKSFYFLKIKAKLVDGSFISGSSSQRTSSSIPITGRMKVESLELGGIILLTTKTSKPSLITSTRQKLRNQRK
jgi:hypothetical protein